MWKIKWKHTEYTVQYTECSASTQTVNYSCSSLLLNVLPVVCTLPPPPKCAYNAPPPPAPPARHASFSRIGRAKSCRATPPPSPLPIGWWSVSRSVVPTVFTCEANKSISALLLCPVVVEKACSDKCKEIVFKWRTSSCRETPKYATSLIDILQKNAVGGGRWPT